MTNWSPRDRFRITDIGRKLSLPFPSLILCIPVETKDARYDPFAQGATDPSDATLDRTGTTITSWRIIEIKARMGSPNITDFHYPALAAAGYTAQDMLVFIQQSDMPNMQQVIDQENAYVWLAGLTYRPFNVTQIGVFEPDERFIHLKKQTVREHASGYEPS